MGLKNEGYKRSGSLLYIKKPEFEELEYTRTLWGDYNTMRDIGGVYDFTERHKTTFYKKMVSPTDGKNFYCLVYRNDGTPIGEVSFHGYDSANKIARLNIKIQNQYRGNGYGSEAIKLILEYYFYEFGGEVIVDTVSKENKIGENTLKKLGFSETTPKSYRLRKKEFIEIRSIEKIEVAMIAFNGVSLSRLGFISECLNKCEKENLGPLNIDILSKSEVVKSSIGIKFKVDEVISTRKKYDMVIFLDGINITKETETIKKIFKQIINNANSVVAMDSSIPVLLELEYLRGMNATLIEEQRASYRSSIWGYNYVESDLIDNGKFLLFKGIKGVMEGSLHLVEKLYGKNKLDKIKNYI
ncbi:GNAT family N-acetyltransferase [uncultured Clostridium sp.]|jgi:RimJ/RimL family protein N-acetyltransferase|uniref:GNAT family N-acetyltransferase n=1 Tax=uncultured Clostridium sp. TaxID=59620 RepID=UPI0026195051|nr:GNAT family N-acetyltransferase [uncultured Clostridium sp.]